ncbi:hypothetical protein ACIQU6_43405 [Streptomyces sp. NPDC090442]|uniref:hypothetical protein n=1 Tax=Streptomyces sp. NPDC090442 TaxID=3365962 RepID=UPI0038196234
MSTDQSHVFTSQAAASKGVLDHLGLRHTVTPVSNTRDISKHHMIHNTATPDISVDPETYEVRANGAALTCEPAEVLPLAQRYFI